MLWIYVLAGTLGFVLLVPTLLRTLDGLPTDMTAGAVGFTATVFGATGFLLQQFDMRTVTAVVAALALGLAAGAIHPEVLKALSPGKTAPANLSEDSA